MMSEMDLETTINCCGYSIEAYQRYVLKNHERPDEIGYQLLALLLRIKVRILSPGMGIKSSELNIQEFVSKVKGFNYVLKDRLDLHEDCLPFYIHEGNFYILYHKGFIDSINKSRTLPLNVLLNYDKPLGFVVGVEKYKEPIIAEQYPQQNVAYQVEESKFVAYIPPESPGPFIQSAQNPNPVFNSFPSTGPLLVSPNQQLQANDEDEENDENESVFYGTFCVFCKEYTKGAKTVKLLLCKHRVHAQCLSEYVLAQTNHLVFLTPTEQRDVILYCKGDGCGHQVTESDVKQAFAQEAISYYEQKRNGREVEEHHQEEFKLLQSQGELITLQCCDNPISIPDFLQGYKENKNRIIHRKADVGWQYLPCIYCEKPMIKKDLQIIFKHRFEDEVKKICCNCFNQEFQLNSGFQLLSCSHCLCLNCIYNILFDLTQTKKWTPAMEIPIFYCYHCEKQRELSNLINNIYYL